MKNILNALIVVLFVTIIHGFPQQRQDSSSPQIDGKIKDSLTQPKPLDRSQISTFPATVDFKKQDNVPQKDTKTISTSRVDSNQGSTPQNFGDNRKTRDTSPVDSIKKQDTPYHVIKDPILDSNNKQKSGPQKLSEESINRKTRGVDSSKHRNPSDIESNHHHQQPQTHQTKQDNRPSHSTRDSPVSANAHHPHPSVDTHNAKH